MSQAYVDFPRHIISPWTTSLIPSLCRICGFNNFSLHPSICLMSSMSDYIFMKPLDKCVMIIINIPRSSRISIEFMMRNTILAPQWFVLSSATFLLSLQHKLVHVLCCTLISLLSSLGYDLPCSITVFYIKNVVRITPPLKNSWYSNTSGHLSSYLGPRVVSKRNTDQWSVMCKF